MNQRFIFLVGLLWVVGIGCSGSSDKVPSPEELYAVSTKRTVLEFVQRAKASPREITTELDGLLEGLTDLETHPVGKHKEVYEKLLAAATKIKSAAKSQDWPTVEAKLDEMTNLANQLPGDVKADVREAGGEDS